MFTWLRSLISHSCVLEVSAQRIRVRDLGNGQVHEFAPVLGIDASKCVVSIGRPVSATAVETFEPFLSRKSLAENERIAELLLQYAYSKVGSSRWLKPAPKVLMLLPSRNDDPLLHVDDSTFVELSSRAGAHRTVVRRGERIADEVAASLVGEA